MLTRYLAEEIITFMNTEDNWGPKKMTGLLVSSLIQKITIILFLFITYDPPILFKDGIISVHREQYNTHLVAAIIMCFNFFFGSAISELNTCKAKKNLSLYIVYIRDHTNVFLKMTKQAYTWLINISQWFQWNPK